MKLFKVFELEQLNEIKECINKCKWHDGKHSAKGSAVNKKKNFQISSSDPNFKPIYRMIKQAHDLKDPLAYTYYNEIVNPRVASYTDGGHYDWHVDLTHLDNKRTDLSFTIFLNSPQDYEGGEMLIQMVGRNFQLKGDAGMMVVYPSGMLHKVNPVTDGNRLVIVGWLNSHIKSEEHRERLLTMRIEMAKTQELIGVEKMEGWDRIYSQLVRDFS